MKREIVKTCPKCKGKSKNLLHLQGHRQGQNKRKEGYIMPKRPESRTIKCKECGKEVPWFANKMYCTECAHKRHRNRIAAHHKTEQANNKTYKSRTIAICPMCRREHKVVVKWIGNGTPRIYCESCKTVDVVQFAEQPANVYAAQY